MSTNPEPERIDWRLERELEDATLDWPDRLHGLEAVLRSDIKPETITEPPGQTFSVTTHTMVYNAERDEWTITDPDGTVRIVKGF